MNHRSAMILPLFLILATTDSGAQSLISPEVHPDRSVTFRLRAPNAQKVMVAREGIDAIAMQKDTGGVWSVTTPSWEPDVYGYSFIVDGVGMFDPSNPVIKNNLLYTQSLLEIRGPESLPWQQNNVPHGTIHHHYYHSAIVGDDRDFYVYTPPGYDPLASTRYPVLYLLHGYSDDASGWTAVGRAQFILDNLIAQGKAKPMLVVMPLGYGAPEIVSKVSPGLRDPSLRDRNYRKFVDALLTEVVPSVEQQYRVLADRASRAIAGLSMGGAESLFAGLNNLDRFAWIGAFSSGGLDNDFEKVFPGLTSDANGKIRLLWISCGTDDGLITVNRKLNSWLDTKGIRHTQVETPGSHAWMVWRRNLAEFVPLLFRETKP